jgi:hypothetical protein
LVVRRAGKCIAGRSLEDARSARQTAHITK